MSHNVVHVCKQRSALGETCAFRYAGWIPACVFLRANSRQRGLAPSKYCNNFKFAVYGRELKADDRLREGASGDCQAYDSCATVQRGSNAMETF